MCVYIYACAYIYIYIYMCVWVLEMQRYISMKKHDIRKMFFFRLIFSYKNNSDEITSHYDIVLKMVLKTETVIMGISFIYQ